MTKYIIVYTRYTLISSMPKLFLAQATAGFVYLRQQHSITQRINYNLYPAKIIKVAA